MKLPEIVDLLKEIVNASPGLAGTDFLLAPSKIADSPFEEYEIHMTGDFDDITRKNLNEIALTKKLFIRQEPKSIMLYRAKKT